MSTTEQDNILLLSWGELAIKGLLQVDENTLHKGLISKECYIGKRDREQREIEGGGERD